VLRDWSVVVATELGLLLVSVELVDGVVLLLVLPAPNVLPAPAVAEPEEDELGLVELVA
jgi:hypothetical protein